MTLIKWQSVKGKKWVGDNVLYEKWQEYGNSIICDGKMATDIVAGMKADGLRENVDFVIIES